MESWRQRRRLGHVRVARAAIESLEQRTMLSGHTAHPTHPVHPPHPVHPRHLSLNPELAEPEEKDEDEGAVFASDVTPGPNAPPVSGTIEAANFDTNPSFNGGFLFIPPDSSGAVGPGHVMNVINCVVQWFTKAGTLQNTQSLQSFFSAQSPVNSLFDPKVLYDQYNSRFIVVAMEQRTSPTTSSRILLAVSDDSDPNGTWFSTSINSKLNIGGLDRWADYPGFGFDANALYVTANMFAFSGGSSGGSRLWIINKSTFYTGGGASVALYDPSALAGVGFSLFTLQPAQMYGTAPSGMGTFLVSSGIIDGSHNDYLSVIKIANPLGSPTFTNTFISLGNTHNDSAGIPLSPQLGSATGIATNDDRLINAVWRNNNLYAANTTNPVSGLEAGQATTRWYRITANGSASPALADTGIVSGEDIAVGAYTYFPSVNVDTAGDMAISFSASASSIFAGAYYTGRLASDPAGTVQPSGTLAAGLDFYVRKFGGTSNRWGDYSAIALDPSDGATFWPYNQYALTRGSIISGEDGRWGTRWGKFALIGGAIAGQIYEDRLTNGVFDGSDIAINGVTVFLDSNNNTALDGGEPSVVTSGAGNFTFGGLVPATYHLREIIPAGYIANSPAGGAIDVVVAASTVTQNLGNFPVTYTGTAGVDTYLLRLDVATSTKVELLVNGILTYSIPKVSLTSQLTFNPGDGNDSLTVDEINGNPIPTQVNFDGGNNTDTFTLLATAGVDNVNFSNANVGGFGTPIFNTNVEGITFDGRGGNDVINISGGPTVTFPASQRFDSLSMGAGVAVLAANGSRVINTNTLSIFGSAKLDLSDNDMVIRSGALGTWTGSDYSDITGLVRHGYSNGTWSGNGIVTSQPAALASRSRTRLGVALASDALGIGALATTTWGTEVVNGNAVLVKYTWMGDANLSGNVNGDDYFRVDNAFPPQLKGFVNGDFNYDGTLNADDYFLIDQTYSSQGPTL